MSKYYRKVAKELAVHYLFGRWAVSFGSHFPEGDREWRIRFIPLDGWITDEKEIAKVMKARDYEL